jgi:hypothetical protein
MGDRVVDCARLESVCAERHRGFESPPIRFIGRATAREQVHKDPHNTNTPSFVGIYLLRVGKESCWRRTIPDHDCCKRQT